jgi:HlyD family secretion protein
MKTWMMRFVLVAVLAALGYVGYTQYGAWQMRWRQEAEANRLTTAPAVQTNINFAVSAAGEIGPAEQVSVRPEINGLLNELPVDIGDRVKKGSLLFGLNDRELQQQKASSLTAVERAKLELDKASRDHERAKAMLAANLISQELYDNTKTTFELAKNALELSGKELAILEERLTKTRVSAPFDCTVLTRPVSIGQAVAGSGGFNSGTEVLTIADLNHMIVNAHVNQADVPRLSVNQDVEVAVEAVTGLVVTGAVERIAPQATIKNNIKGFATRVRIENPDGRIRPGMTANVKVPVASAANVVAVPLAAVFTERSADTGEQERYVYVQCGDTFEKRAVQVGVSDFFYAEIQGGLRPGEIVSLELPKEEREKQSKALAGMKPGSDGGPGSVRPLPGAGRPAAAAAASAPGGAGAVSRPAGPTGVGASRPGSGASGAR